MAERPKVLVAAVLKEVPGTGSSRAERIGWLRMIAMALDTAYGVDGSAIDVPDFLGRPADPPLLSDSPNAQQPAPSLAKPQLVRTVEPPRFFIDHAGHARHAPSMRAVNPEELQGETLFDDRGEHGDLGSILWANGSRGVLGLQLAISATPAAKRA